MARYDKYDPISGGFRAPLAADLALTNGEFGPRAVSLDANGRVVVGTAGQSGAVGILVKNAARQSVGGRWTSSLGTPNPQAPIGCMAGDVVDVMTAGEIVDLGTSIAGLKAGAAVYATAAGALSVTDTTGKRIGYTVEANRLVVRVAA